MPLRSDPAEAAVGGVFGTRFAAPFVVTFVLVTWFLQIVGNLLGLPDVIKQLADDRK